MINKEINPKPIEVKSENVNNVESSISLEKKIFSSLKSGIFAFSIVLTFTELFKILAVSSKTNINFEISGNDLIFSFWAFIVISFIELSHHFKS